MKEVTIMSVNGIAFPEPKTKAIQLKNCIKWYENVSGFCVVRYDKKPGTNIQPESLTLNINKATFDALVATVTTITTISLSVYDTWTGVKTTTAFNDKYLISMEDSEVDINGIVDTSVVEVIYGEGSFITKKIFADGALSSLVISNGAEILTYAFASVANTVYTVDNSARTIHAVVPNGTTITALVATFTVSPNITSVEIGTVAQVSASTANNFTTPQTYTIVAQDGVTTRNWVVTVTVAP